MAAMSLLAPKKHLGRANGIVMTSDAVSMVVAPAARGPAGHRGPGSRPAAGGPGRLPALPALRKDHTPCPASMPSAW